jgi:MFS family permease
VSGLRLSRTVILLGVTSFFTDLGSDMIFPLLPVFVSDTLGGGAAFLGIIEGAADALASLLKLLSGLAADRFSRRKPLVVAGYGLASLVRPFMAVATAPWHALLVRLLDRTGKGIRSAPRDALIADTTDPASTGRAFGFHRAMDHAGAVVGPLVATGLLSAHVPVRRVFLVAAIPGLLAFVAVIMVREKSGPERDVRLADTKAASALPKDLVRYLVILLLFSLGNSTDAFLLLRAREMGVSLAAIPVLWALLHVSKMVWSYAGGVWSDGTSRVRLILSGWIVYFVTYLAIAQASRAWQAWALFVVYGAFYGLSEPAEKALVKDLAPADARGTSFGYYNFIVGAAGLPAGVLTGWLWSEYGHAAALSAGAAIALTASVLLAVWSATRARPVGSDPGAA